MPKSARGAKPRRNSALLGIQPASRPRSAALFSRRSFSPMTRRDFLEKAGRYGGATFTAMTALGLLSRATGQGAELKGLPAVTGKPGTKVVILGAGIAGMTAAYEL
ncbi:MAG: hypothetical protein ABUL77_02505, partial [Bacteroidota bacterium]